MEIELLKIIKKLNYLEKEDMHQCGNAKIFMIINYMLASNYLSIIQIIHKINELIKF